MPEQICLEERCPNPATYRGRCSTHAKRRDKSIERAASPGFYQSLKWRKTREAKILINGKCERCGRPTEEVHHRHGVEVDPWSMDGLESLCSVCHGRETRQAQLAGVGEGR